MPFKDRQVRNLWRKNKRSADKIRKALNDLTNSTAANYSVLSIVGIATDPQPQPQNEGEGRQTQNTETIQPVDHPFHPGGDDDHDDHPPLDNPESDEDEVIEIVGSLDNPEEDDEGNDKSDEDGDHEVRDDPPMESLEAKLFDFMAENQITHAAMHSLLAILNSYAGKIMPELPRNPRTLMTRYASTQRFLEQTDTFIYLGIEEALATLYNQNVETKELINAADTIELAFNVDGLPLSGECVLLVLQRETRSSFSACLPYSLRFYFLTFSISSQKC